MELIRLNNNKTIPALGFGTFQITDEKVCEDSVLTALHKGYRLIDTAACYGNERAVGKAIARSNLPRNKIYISSKVWIQDAGYEKTKESFKKTLDNLQTDYLDLYLIHMPYGDYYGSWKAMEELYEEGRISTIGVCNFEADSTSVTEEKVMAETMAEEPAGDSRTTEDTITETMTSPAAAEETESSKKAGSETDTGTGNSEILVAYFSATRNTKTIAEKLADGLNADLYEIVLAQPYTEADLDYNDDDSRSTQEMNDSSVRPELAGTIENFEDYTTVYLGYPKMEYSL